MEFSTLIFIFATMKLQTPVTFPSSRIPVTHGDRIMAVGSCFADQIGNRLVQGGFSACVNPFGTLYNPVSIAAALSRLCAGKPFTESECVEMGAGAGLICSFSHHTSFARATAEEFLRDANRSLEDAAAFWQESNKVLITLGTVFCWLHDGVVVANCLKRPAAGFERAEMTLEQVTAVLRSIVLNSPDKEFIFTVSPIRHLRDGAHLNQISKSTLLLGIDALLRDPMVGQRCAYFPAYEIMMDELRDYRFYAEDMTHPTAQAADYIWERFVDFAVPPGEREAVAAAEKAWRASQHRPMHGKA